MKLTRDVPPQPTDSTPYYRIARSPGMEVRIAESDPNGKPLSEPGAKADAGKCLAGVLHDFSLALQDIADIGSFGAKKYTRGGWQSVPDAETRYFDAMWRHLLKSRHEDLDPDSGLPHLAHMAWNLLAVLELQGRDALRPSIGG